MLPPISRQLVTDTHEGVQLLRHWLAADTLPPMGFDSETDSKDFPYTLLVGFSLFHPTEGAYYFPLAHDCGGNLDWDLLAPYVRDLFARATLIAHAWAFDLPLFVARGITPNKIKDTHVLSQTLQAQNSSLKDQVLEYRLVSFKDVASYPEIIALTHNVSLEDLKKWPEGDLRWGFNTVNPFTNTRAVQYACDDAIWTALLCPILEREHDELVGTKEAAEFLRNVNNDVAALLGETAAIGYACDPLQIEIFIKNRQAEILAEEKALKVEVRQALGWGAPSDSDTEGVFALLGRMP